MTKNNYSHYTTSNDVPNKEGASNRSGGAPSQARGDGAAPGLGTFGGATLGAALGGTPGAVVGGIIGFLIGKHAK